MEFQVQLLLLVLNHGSPYLCEFGSVVKGAGRILLQKILSDYDEIAFTNNWEVSGKNDPEKLKEYYRSFPELKEYKITDMKSIFYKSDDPDFYKKYVDSNESDDSQIDESDEDSVKIVKDKDAWKCGKTFDELLDLWFEWYENHKDDCNENGIRKTSEELFDQWYSELKNDNGLEEDCECGCGADGAVDCQCTDCPTDNDGTVSTQDIKQIYSLYKYPTMFTSRAKVDKRYLFGKKSKKKKK